LPPLRQSQSARKESNLRPGPYKDPALTTELRAENPVGPEGVEPSPGRLKAGCAAITPRPHVAGLASAFEPLCVPHCLFSLFVGVVRGGVEPGTARSVVPGDVSDRYASVTTSDLVPSRDGGSRTRAPCAAWSLVFPKHAGRRYPTSRCFLSVRTAGLARGDLLAPDQAPVAALLRSGFSSSSGSRTPASGLKGRHPQPLDERAVLFVVSGSGGARILVSWFSARCYTVSATDP
jgi:hypothetical protein